MISDYNDGDDKLGVESKDEGDLVFVYQELLNQESDAYEQRETTINRYIWICFANVVLLLYFLVSHVIEGNQFNSFLFNILSYMVVVCVLLVGMEPKCKFYNMLKTIQKKQNEPANRRFANIFYQCLSDPELLQKPSKTIISFNTVMVCLQMWVVGNLIWMIY